MIRAPDDPYDSEAEDEREMPTGTPWTVIGLMVVLAVALVLYCAGLV